MNKNSMTRELSVIIPFYNEEGNVSVVINSLLEALEKAHIGFEILALDNGSADRTGLILDRIKDKRVRVFHIKVNKGYGNGIIECLKHAKGGIVGYMWGDNEIPAHTLVDVYNKLKDESLDVCKICRDQRGYQFMRRMQSEIYNRIVLQVLFGSLPPDINGCPRLMRREVCEKINLVSRDDFIDTEIVLKAKGFGFRIGGVRAKYYKRSYGKSKLGFYKFLFFLRNMINYKLRRERFKN